MGTLGKRWKNRPETAVNRWVARRANGNVSPSDETRAKISKTLTGRGTGRFSTRTEEEKKQARKDIEKRYLEKHPEKPRQSQVKYFYKLSPEQHIAILEKQNYKCAISACPAIINKRSPIDHDHRCCPSAHSCGKCVRGILCNRHNVGLAHFQDNVDELRTAAEYVEWVR
jgi:hypothetical protein